MIPWLLVAALMSSAGKSLSQLVGEHIEACSCTGEIKYRVKDVSTTLDKVLACFLPQEPEIDKADGISVSLASWRFNLRGRIQSLCYA
ncbi:hypothetical protein [Pseudomonas chlororaphis]|uniref:hypothetical protein n=1 Tax=Pseudomonas chlororaphis TaxID=587753 RepID=UPI003BB1E456